MEERKIYGNGFASLRELLEVKLEGFETTENIIIERKLNNIN